MSWFGRWLGFDTEEICEAGLAALDRRDFISAAEAFEICLRQSTREATLRLAKFHLGECYFQIAEAAFRRAEYESAEESVDRSLSFGPSNAERHLLAARILRRLGQTAAMESQIDLALNFSPDHPAARALRAASWYEDGREEEAIAQASPNLIRSGRYDRFFAAHRLGDRSAAMGHLLASGNATGELL